MMAGQLPLPLQWQQASGAQDFFIGDCNRDAVQWLENGRSSWGHHASFLIGPEKSGKSHLAGIFAQKYGGDIISARTPAQLQKQLNAPSAVLVIDDLGAGIDEVSLFHLYNNAHLSGGTLLMVAASSPREWPVQLPDLASRLGASPKVLIAAPDDEVLAAVLIKQLRDLGWSASPDVIAFLVPRMERSFAAAQHLVQALHARGEHARRDLTVPLAAEVLKRLENDIL
jgi:chromosomal replication initiation ATPase DnaA